MSRAGRGVRAVTGRAVAARRDPGRRRRAAEGPGAPGRCVAASSGPPHPAKGGGKGLGGEQVEGRQAVRELLIAGRRKVHELWLSTELVGHDGEPDDGVADIVALARANRVPVANVARGKLDARARSEAPQGVIAFAAPLPEVELSELTRRRPGKPPFLVAVDGVTDPGNLGAIIRSCEGAGVHGVLLPRHRAVHVTPTVAKASAGAVEHLPMALVGGLPATLTRLRDAGIWVVGLDDAGDRSLFDLGDLAAEGICLVLGAEGGGLVDGSPASGATSSSTSRCAAASARSTCRRQRHSPPTRSPATGPHRPEVRRPSAA